MWVAFALQKLLTFFCNQNINVSENILATTANEFLINELVKLTMFEQLGPGKNLHYAQFEQPRM